MPILCFAYGRMLWAQIDCGKKWLAVGRRVCGATLCLELDQSSRLRNRDSDVAAREDVLHLCTGRRRLGIVSRCVSSN